MCLGGQAKCERCSDVCFMSERVHVGLVCVGSGTVMKHNCKSRELGTVICRDLTRGHAATDVNEQ